MNKEKPTPTSVLPPNPLEKVDDKVGASLINVSEGTKSLLKFPEKLLSVITKGPCTLFGPLRAKLEGITAKIELENLTFTEELDRRKNENAEKLAVKVLENLSSKVEKGEEIPEQIKDSDNLVAIQTAAMEYKDDDFLQFWANLYTEEACTPGSISKAAINLCNNLDKNIVRILEEDIFPYCDNAGGLFWGAEKEKLNFQIIAEDYGFLSHKPISWKFKDHSDAPVVAIRFGKYSIILSPNFKISTNKDILSDSILLTTIGQEVKKSLQIETSKEHFNIIINNFEKASKLWELNDETKQISGIKKVDKFIALEDEKIIYPEQWKHKSISDYINYIKSTFIAEIPIPSALP